MKKRITTEQAPSAIGPYSQAIQISSFLFVSGQIPLCPRTGEIVDSSIEESTHQVMQNIQAILKEADLSMKDVVKTTLFLTDLKHFGQVNEVYGSYFEGTNPPARSTIEVSALPRGASVEIESIAFCSKDVPCDK